MNKPIQAKQTPEVKPGVQGLAAGTMTLETGLAAEGEEEGAVGIDKGWEARAGRLGRRFWGVGELARSWVRVSGLLWETQGVALGYHISRRWRS